MHIASAIAESYSVPSGPEIVRYARHSLQLHVASLQKMCF